MISWLKSSVLELLGRTGRRVTRDPLKSYLDAFGIDCIFDVGANVGQYGTALRRLGYRRRIESFEPIPAAYDRLEGTASSDSLWRTHRFGLGSEQGVFPITVSANTPSSSFLELDSATVRVPVDLSAIGRVDVRVECLDDVFFALRGAARRVFLKIDTQGFEKQVLNGAVRSLPEFTAVQAELSLVANYRGEALIEELIAYMRSQLFDPWWIMDGFRNPDTLQLYQADVFFVNRRQLQSPQRA